MQQYHDTVDSVFPGGASAVEAEIWNALELDVVGEKMIGGVFPDGDPIFMGTGHTHNACYMCSNSATTHGCGTCG